MSLTIEVKVVPSSGKNGWICDKSGMLKCYLKSPPEKGKANEELVKIIAKALGVTLHLVSIVSGYQSRKKVVKIDTDMSREDFMNAVGITAQVSDKQIAIFD